MRTAETVERERTNMRTSVQGEPAEWDEAIRAAWERVISRVDDDRPIIACNFFEPRPWRNEYDRGSSKWGFTYTRALDDYKREVYQVQLTRDPRIIEPVAPADEVRS